MKKNHDNREFLVYHKKLDVLWHDASEYHLLFYILADYRHRKHVGRDNSSLQTMADQGSSFFGWQRRAEEFKRVNHYEFQSVIFVFLTLQVINDHFEGTLVLLDDGKHRLQLDVVQMQRVNGCLEAVHRIVLMTRVIIIRVKAFA
jgi:hypothetical protein